MDRASFDDWVARSEKRKELRLRALGDAAQFEKKVLKYDGTQVFRGATVTPAAREPGKWQVSYFDEDGFSTHDIAPTREKALEELAREGGWRPAKQDHLARLVKTRRFMQGVERTYAIGMGNEVGWGEGRGNDILAEFEKGGLKAAEAKYKQIKHGVTDLSAATTEEQRANMMKTVRPWKTTKVMQLVEKLVDPETSVLDYGSGPQAIQTIRLRDKGFRRVMAHDINPEKIPGVHIDPATTEKFGAVAAGNVLNVQPNADAMRATLKDIARFMDPSGVAIVNYTGSGAKPGEVTNWKRPSGITPEQLEKEFLPERFREFQRIPDASGKMNKAEPNYLLRNPILAALLAIGVSGALSRILGQEQTA